MDYNELHLYSLSKDFRKRLLLKGGILYDERNHYLTTLVPTAFHSNQPDEESKNKTKSLTPNKKKLKKKNPNPLETINLTATLIAIALCSAIEE